MLSRVLIKKQQGRRWLTFLAVAGLLVMTMGISGSVLAVHDEKFQLDGDTTPSVAQSVPDPAVQTRDWESLFNANGTATSVIDTTAATGFNGGSFKRDFSTKASRTDACSLTGTGTTFCTNDATTYATGSKDTLDIPDWQCTQSNNVNSKIDIMNAYAAQFVTAGGDRILYFGLDKNKDNGSNNVAFWFLQDEVGCTSAGSATDFTGVHRDGDVLVVSAFTNGGGVSNIDAYRWDGVAGCIDNPSNPASCDGLAVSSGGDCKNAPAEDDICATTNSGPLEENDNITTSWLTSNGTAVGHTVVPPDFFEGGINLTEAFENAPSCFSTFLADTRSSPSLTATLFDFAGGTLGNCQTTLTTEASGVGGDGTIGDGSISSGTDTAALSISGTSVWAGTLSFYLCGPDEDLVTCDPDDGVLVNEQEVDNTSPAADFVSDTATLTSAGRYCWVAHFEPDQETSDAGVDPADDDGTDECFDVDPVTPTLTTTAGADAVLGQPVTDTAVLGGAATEPGTNGGNTTYPSINATDLAYAGTIQFTLKGPSTTGCGSTATGTGTNPQTVNVDTTTGNKSYGPVSFTPNQVGNFHWTATYTNTGSANNTSPVTDNANCTETREDVTVTGSAAFTTAQEWLPNDSATLTGPTNLTGTLRFKLYNDATCGANGGIVQYDSLDIAVSNVASGTTFNTSNTNFKVTASGSYSWLVTYNDTTLNDPANSCKEDTSLTIDNTTAPAAP